jgi:GWxTD domain-containing protein
MKYVKYLLITHVLLQGVLYAQYYESSKYSGIGIPFFEVEIFRTFADDAKSGQVILFYELLYDDLTFVKSDTGSGYVSQFELIAGVYDEQDRGLQSKTLNKEWYLKDFALTNSRTEQVYLTQKFNLGPGKYVLKLQLHDLISKKHANRKIDLEIEDFQNKAAALSDLLFISDVVRDSSGNIIDFQPRVKENLSRQSDFFYVYHNLYVRDIPATVSLTYSLEDKKEIVRMDTTLEKEVTEHLSAHVWRVDKRDLSKNRYKCVVKLKTDDEEEIKSKNLSFFWITVPETEDDLSLALRQMRYILPQDSLSKYEDKSIEEQRKFFRDYWQDRDPNPNTAVNELMEEYFRRVNYANREFSNFNEGGWLSDRGRILIKFGFPDDVERHPFDINSVPYVIWRYYALRKTFVFADQTGFGDYRLLPQYMNQEFN